MVDTDDTRRTTNDGRRTTPRVWHKLPTGELKKGAGVPKLVHSSRLDVEARCGECAQVINVAHRGTGITYSMVRA